MALPYALVAMLLAGVALGLGAATVAGLRGEVRYADLPVVRLALPPLRDVAGTAAEPAPAPPAPSLTEEQAPPSLAPEPEVAARPPETRGALAAGTSSPTARVERVVGEARSGGPSYPPGRTGRPRVAVVVTGLGLAQVPSEAALRLPAGVALAVSPYADDAAGWLARVRRSGHDALLMLPAEPADPARVDPGPRAVGVRQDPRQRRAALDWLVARGRDHVAIAGEAGAFAAAPEAWAPVARFLADRGLGFVELGGSSLAGAAADAGVPYLAADGRPLDEATLVGGAGGVDSALVQLEDEAAERGGAVTAAWARLQPVTLARLGAWATTLPGKGLALVPVSNLLRPERLPLKGETTRR